MSDLRWLDTFTIRVSNNDKEVLGRVLGAVFMEFLIPIIMQ